MKYPVEETPKLLLEFLAAASDGAVVPVPGLGKFVKKIYPAYVGRNPETGEDVSVPANSGIYFLANLDLCDTEIQHFLSWVGKQFPDSAAQALNFLGGFGSKIAAELATSKIVMLEGLGTIVDKIRPPKAGFNPETREPLVIEPREVRSFYISSKLRAKLNGAAVHEPHTQAALSIRPLELPTGNSTFTCDAWPSGPRMQEICRILAVLSIYHQGWVKHLYRRELTPGIDVAVIENGQGDNCHIFFSGQDILMRGFGHESPMASWYNGGEPWPGTYDGIPQELFNKLFVNCIVGEDTSFAAWYLHKTKRWHVGSIQGYPNVSSSDPDGSGLLLSYLPSSAAEYIGLSYNDAPSAAVQETIADIFNLKPLTKSMVLVLNPKAEFNLESILKIGYPIGDK
jgi:nucleoid DNA-binding protein